MPMGAKFVKIDAIGLFVKSYNNPAATWFLWLGHNYLAKKLSMKRHRVSTGNKSIKISIWVRFTVNRLKQNKPRIEKYSSRYCVCLHTSKKRAIKRIKVEKHTRKDSETGICLRGEWRKVCMVACNVEASDSST